MNKASLFLLLICWLASFYTTAADINSIRVWPAPDHIRIVFDLSEQVDYQLLSLANPQRIVLDIFNAHLKTL